MNTSEHVKALLVALCAISLGSTGCTELKTVSRADIIDAGRGTEKDAGQDAAQDAGYDSDVLCEIPDTPVPIPLVPVGSEVCSTSTEAWPRCLADECDASEFETACRQFCQMRCERDDWYCSGYCARISDEPSYCDSDEVLDECEQLCGSDADCLHQACEDSAATECQDTECPSNAVPSDCNELTCDNSCDSAFNGVCEDGSAVNSVQSICEDGTDCADCGPRAACFDLGDECVLTIQCCGFETGDAYCINVGSEKEKLGRCVAVCEGPDDCDEGYACRKIMQMDTQVCVPICSIGN